MDVLIKGFNRPNKCKECPCREYGEFSYESDWCCLNEENIEDVEVVSSKCPLIILPQHGDLIDIEKLKELLLHMWTKNEKYTISDVFREIPDIPVVIKSNS